MKVAFLLYGQPRDYSIGFAHINNFVKKQKGVHFDFFFHCWTIEKGQTYPHSPWRTINKNSRNYSENVVEHLNQLYNPCAMSHEQQITDFPKSLYDDTIAYKEYTVNNPALLKNINNTLSQMYSRNKVRNLLYNHMKEHNSNYDFVIMTRFDYKYSPNINLNYLDTSTVYAADTLCPRKLIPDTFIISPTNVFLDWFNIYDEIESVINNLDLMNTVLKFGEHISLNPEQLIFAKYILHNKNVDKVRYLSSIESGLI